MFLPWSYMSFTIYLITGYVDCMQLLSPATLQIYLFQLPWNSFFYSFCFMQLDENFSMGGQYQQRNVLTFFWIFFLHLMHLFIGSAQALHTSLCPQGVNTMTLSACSHFIQRSCFFNIWFSSSMTSGSTSVNNKYIIRSMNILLLEAHFVFYTQALAIYRHQLIIPARFVSFFWGGGGGVLFDFQNFILIIMIINYGNSFFP